MRIEWKVLEEVWETHQVAARARLLRCIITLQRTFSLRAYMCILIAKGWNDDDTKVYVCEKTGDLGIKFG